MSEYKYPGYPETNAALAQWATDAAYPAGSDSWSAQPTKAQPSLAFREQGHTPGTIPTAEEMNWLQNQLAQLCHLNHASKWCSWTFVDHDSTMTALPVGQGEPHCQLWNLLDTQWFAPSSTAEHYLLAYPGGALAGEVDTGRTENLTLRTFAGAPGSDVILAGGICNAPGSFSGIYRSTNRGATWSAVALSTGTDSFCKIYKLQHSEYTEIDGTAGPGITVALGTVKAAASTYRSALWLSADQGATWVFRETVGPADATENNADPSFVLLMPDDVWVITNQSANCLLWGGFDVTTRANETSGTFGIGARARAAAYNPISDVVMLIDEDGNVWTTDSANPASWTHVATMALGNFDTLSKRNELYGDNRSCHLVSMGGAWLLYLKSPNMICASFDDGANWSMYAGCLPNACGFVDGGGSSAIEQRLCMASAVSDNLAFGPSAAMLHLAASSPP